MSLRFRLVAPLALCVVLVTSCGATNDPVGGDRNSAIDGSGGEPEEFGPLALHPDGPSGDEALIGGEIEVTNDCVLLHHGDYSTLLLWSALSTSWDAGSQTVIYRDRDGNEVALKDGDMAAFGGGDSLVGQGGQSVQEFLDAHDWVSEPDPVCLTTGGAWFVGEYVDPAVLSIGDSQMTDAASADADPSSSAEAVSTAQEQESGLPVIRSSDYLEFVPVEQRRIEFKAPVSEADARAWAERSGFRIVVIEGERLETMYTSERIVLQTDDAGQIVGAEVG